MNRKRWHGHSVKPKYQTEGEKVYEAEVEKIKEEISAKQKNIDEIKQRFLNPSSKNYISPDAKDYHLAKNIADEKVSRYNFEIQELQRKLQQLYQNKGKYVNAGSNQVGLFGTRRGRKKRKTATSRLNLPTADLIDQQSVADLIPVPQPNGAKNFAEAMNQDSPSEIFQVPGDIGRFLGQVERKPVHSVVTTLDAEQGAGKTRFLFQVMNVLSGMGLKVLFYSLEEHPASKLFKDKVSQYIAPANLQNISVIDEVQNWSKESSVIEAHDAISLTVFKNFRIWI